MVSHTIKKHCPAFRAMVTNEDIGGENNREGLSTITQPVDHFIEEAPQNLNIPLAEQANQ